MKSYRLRLRPLAGWITPWRADSLFGSLCWARVGLGGKDALFTWLDRFCDDDPPFVLSDAFPGTLLPAPLDGRTDPPRKAKPPYWISEASFRELCGDGDPKIKVKLAHEDKSPILESARLQASLGRDTDSTENGELFQIDYRALNRACFNGSPPVLSVYFHTPTDADTDDLLAAFRALALLGFGKKRTWGMGAFEILGELEHCAWLDRVDGADGFVALSHFVPRADDPTAGRWRTHVGYPKFQGDRVQRYLKGRLLTLAPGSVFRTGGVPRDWYGRMLPVPREGMDKALHYGLCFAAPAKLPPSL